VHPLLRTNSALQTGVLIASFHRDAPASCGALADERRISLNDIMFGVVTGLGAVRLVGSATEETPWMELLC
jgi:hypothetical protein